MGSMSVMEGNDLLLRHLTKQDLDDFTKVVTDPLYGKFSPLGNMTKDVAERALNHIVDNYQSDRYEFWVVVDKKFQSIAGFVGYHPVTFESATTEMFFVGFYPKYWGGKFPAMATAYACQYAFETEKIPKLIVFVHPDDTATLMCTQIMEAKFEKEALFFGATLFLFSLEQKNFNRSVFDALV